MHPALAPPWLPTACSLWRWRTAACMRRSRGGWRPRWRGSCSASRAAPLGAATCSHRTATSSSPARAPPLIESSWDACAETCGSAGAVTAGLGACCSRVPNCEKGGSLQQIPRSFVGRWIQYSRSCKLCIPDETWSLSQGLPLVPRLQQEKHYTEVESVKGSWPRHVECKGLLARGEQARERKENDPMKSSSGPDAEGPAMPNTRSTPSTALADQSIKSAVPQICERTSSKQKSQRVPCSGKSQARQEQRERPLQPSAR